MDLSLFHHSKGEFIKYSNLPCKKTKTNNFNLKFGKGFILTKKDLCIIQSKHKLPQLWVLGIELLET